MPERDFYGCIVYAISQSQNNIPQALLLLSKLHKCDLEENQHEMLDWLSNFLENKEKWRELNRVRLDIRKSLPWAKALSIINLAGALCFPLINARNRGSSALCFILFIISAYYCGKLIQTNKDYEALIQELLSSPLGQRLKQIVSPEEFSSLEQLWRPHFLIGIE